jgi:hypothetical protein
MSGSTFQINPLDLDKLLEGCDSGALQLPDFQRSSVEVESIVSSRLA